MRPIHLHCWPARVGIALSALLLLSQTGEAADSPSILGAEPGLSRPVTVLQPFATLHEILAAIRNETGVQLRADRSIGDENVLVLVRQRPAAEVLEQLAETLDYTWRTVSSGHGYELYQRAEDRRQDERLRVRHRLEAVKALDEECRHRLALTDIDREDASRRQEEARAQLARADTRQERQRLRGELERLRARPGSNQAALLEVYLHLAPLVRERLAQGELLRLSSHLVPGMLPLPPPAAARVVTAHLDSPEWASMLARLPQPPEVRVQIRPIFEQDALTLHLSAELWTAPPEGFAPGWIGAVVRAPLPDLEAPPAPQLPGIAGNPAVFVRPIRRPKFDDPLSWHTSPTLADALVALHQHRTDLAIVGDSRLRGLELWPDDPLPLPELLDLLTEEAGALWEWDSRGYLRIRSRTRYLDRYTDAPASTLRSLGARAERGATLHLDDYIWLASVLTDAQLDATFPTFARAARLTPPTGALNPSVDWRRQELRFLGILTPEQRRALLAGEVLWGETLTVRQLQGLELGLNYAGTDPSGFGRITFWPPAALAEVGFRLELVADAMLGTEGLRFQYLARRGSEPLKLGDLPYPPRP
jgi:hypothetical protein